jgi:transcription elongation factor Elf1
MEKQWRETEFSCPECGNLADVYTNAPDEYFYDGDELKCTECDLTGQITVDEGNAWDMW